MQENSADPLWLQIFNIDCLSDIHMYSQKLFSVLHFFGLVLPCYHEHAIQTIQTTQMTP